MPTASTSRPRSTVRATSRRRSRGQSLVEFALVTPALLLMFAGAADFGRAFYAYVAIENAAKEGALFGARAPLCDDPASGTCDDPNNVVWRVQNELAQQGIRDQDGNELVPNVECQAPDGTPRSSLTNCIEGDIYQVEVVYPFTLATPILGDVIGDLNLTAASRAVVLNLAFDPNPGASINKYVSPAGAVNADQITANCLEPDDSTADGFYRSPCRDSSTPEPNDFLTLRFEEGATIGYRIVVANTGAQSLSGVTVVDSKGSTGCSFNTTLGVGSPPEVCNYARTAPVVTGGALEAPYDNSATVDSAQTEPARSDVRVMVEKAPPRLRVLKWVSPYLEGGDGDGNPSFGTIDDLTVTYRTAPQVSQGTVWYKLIVTNTGGQPATGLAVSDSRGSLPVNANCPAVPGSLAAGASWQCRYSVPFNATSPTTPDNTASATASNVVPDSNDAHTATLHVQACSGGTNRTVPNLIGLTKAQAQTAWTAAGFTGALGDWGSGHNSDGAVTQSVLAYGCAPASTTITITRTPTP